MSNQTQLSPTVIIQRLNTAINQHDLEMFVGCFAPDYQSEQPVHPNRAFVGVDQVRQNWSGIFENLPDMRSELVRFAVTGETVWSEWHWYGTRLDGRSLDFRGTIIFGTQNGRIAWGRLYMEPVEQDSADIDTSVRQVTGQE
jgi:ketosteroid isomerase-like protein